MSGKLAKENKESKYKNITMVLDFKLFSGYSTGNCLRGNQQRDLFAGVSFLKYYILKPVNSS